jgi:hypothetical protein
MNTDDFKQYREFPLNGEVKTVFMYSYSFGGGHAVA